MNKTQTGSEMQEGGDTEVFALIITFFAQVLPLEQTLEGQISLIINADRAAAQTEQWQGRRKTDGEQEKTKTTKLGTKTREEKHFHRKPHNRRLKVRSILMKLKYF